MDDLTIWSNARRAIAEAKTIDEVKTIRDKAEAVRVYYRQIGETLEVQNDVAEIKIRAERRAGELLREMADNGERVTQSEGYNRMASNNTTPILSDLGITRDQSSNWQRIAAIPEPVFEQHVQQTKAAGQELTSAATIRLAKQRQMGVHYSTGEVEWYTPPEIIDRVLQVLGTIDLDPCSNVGNSPNIPATTQMTIEQNGLEYPWHGRVYMNPPYGDTIGLWTDKLKEQYENEAVSQAIALLPSRTDTAWFRQLCQYPRCFIWGRLRFSGNQNSAPFPSMLVYFGLELSTFCNAFCDIGDIYCLLDLTDGNVSF